MAVIIAIYLVFRPDDMKARSTYWKSEDKIKKKLN